MSRATWSFSVLSVCGSLLAAAPALAQTAPYHNGGPAYNPPPAGQPAPYQNSGPTYNPPPAAAPAEPPALAWVKVATFADIGWTLAALSDDALVRSPGDGGLQVSADGGKSFKATKTPFDPLSILPVPATAGMAYADGNPSDGGVTDFVTTDGGKSWKALPGGITLLAVGAADPKTLYGIPTGMNDPVPLMVTTNGGKSWKKAADPVKNQIQPPSVVIANDGTVYAFFPTDANVVVRVSARGAAFKTTGSLPADASAFAVGSDDTLYAAQHGGLDLVASSDDGATWSQLYSVGSDASEGNIASLIVDPSRGTLYMVDTAPSESHLLASTDGGRTWTGCDPPSGLVGSVSLGVDSLFVVSQVGDVDTETPTSWLYRLDLPSLDDNE